MAVADRQASVTVSRARIARSARRALAALGRPAGDVDVDIVDDGEIRRLNASHRGIRRRTDVLAFPLEVPGQAAGLLGQVVISAETAGRHAARLGIPLALEMDLLLTHAILHLVGYDDRDPLEADVMHRREREILASAGGRIPDRLWHGLLRA